MPNTRTVGTSPLRVPSEHTPTDTPTRPVYAKRLVRGVRVQVGWEKIPAEKPVQVVATRTRKGRKKDA
jgi:hypothetical protein